MDENNKILYSKTDFIDTWRAMEDLVRRKLVGSIGVSNFSSSQINEVLKIAKIKPVTNQVCIIFDFLTNLYGLSRK